MTRFNRRQFLSMSAATAGALATLTHRQAFAANTSGYKALVCLYLQGGIDHADTIIPIDLANYENLKAARSELFSNYGVGSGTSSRDRENILPLHANNANSLNGLEFGMPQALSPLQEMFNNGEMGVVGNIGPIIRPTNRDDIAAGAELPSRLFSHNDQRSTWLALDVEGAQYGWGGRFIDAALASNVTMNPSMTALSAQSRDVFLSGKNVRQMQISKSSSGAVSLIDHKWTLGGTQTDNHTRDAIRDYLSRAENGSDSIFERDFARSSEMGIRNAREFRDQMSQAPELNTIFPDTHLGRQLEVISNAISIQSAVNAPRQIFFAHLGSFDTHENQTTRLEEKHIQIADAVTSFREAMIELGQWDDVALFTASEFGRTTIDNGNGTDHGWGGHQMVMGGSVHGRNFYGEMPNTDLSSKIYTEDRGRLIPTTSVEQFAATLGRWFGLDEGELARVLPNLQNFQTKDLGIFGNATS